MDGLNEAERRWLRRPPGSNWGDFGIDDELGRLNLIGPAQVLRGAAEVVAGIRFSLSLPLNLPGGNVLHPLRRPPRLEAITDHCQRPRMNYAMSNVASNALDMVCDDQVALTLQYSTQWDALVHVGSMFDANGDGVPEPVYYNGYRAGHEIHPHSGNVKSGASRLGIENYAKHGLQGRGVLVDLTRVYGRRNECVGYADLERIMREQGVVVEEGDMLLIRTGFSEMLVEMAGTPDIDVLNRSCAALDGRDQALLEWITESGIAALCADNPGVETYPAREMAGSNHVLPLHHHCLFKLGIPLGELWYLKELAEWLQDNERTRFLLTAPPLNLPGAAGSPVTPIATV